MTKKLSKILLLVVILGFFSPREVAGGEQAKESDAFSAGVCAPVCCYLSCKAGAAGVALNSPWLCALASYTGILVGYGCCNYVNNDDKRLTKAYCNGACLPVVVFAGGSALCHVASQVVIP